MKQDLKGTQFADIAQVQRESRRPLTAFPLRILDNVSSIGSGAGIAASSRGGYFEGD